jgi:hypothetical protein
MLPNQESDAAPRAIVWLNHLLLLVNRTIKKKARTGGRGISQIIDSVVIGFLYYQMQQRI